MSIRIDENTDHMKYTDDMEAIDSDIMDRVIAEMNSYDADIYTAKMSKKHWQKLVLLIISKLFIASGIAVFGRNRTESTERDKKTFWKLCSDLYSVIYCKLL